MQKKISLITLCASIGVFIVSLTRNAYCTTNLCRSGTDALISGAFGFMAGGTACLWLANPLLLLAWILIYKKPALSTWLSWAALLFAMLFMCCTIVIDNEAGQVNQIIKRDIGYWLWLISIGMMTLGTSIVSYCNMRLKDH